MGVIALWQNDQAWPIMKPPLDKKALVHAGTSCH